MRRPTPPAAQEGLILFILMLILALGASYLLVNQLDAVTPRLQRSHATTVALARAKTALIAYAVSDPNRPGELPCPDVNNDGQLTMNIDYRGSNCTSLVGRLPWKSLKLPDLRDGSGERLWYAVSPDFHANDTAVLNSDTPGQLTIQGSTPLRRVIAIVFAPGPAINGQVRDTADQNNAAMYLEGGNQNGATTRVFHTARASGTFNDRLLPITHNDLFPVVEKRIARETLNCLNQYANSGNNTFPWPAALSGSVSRTYTATPNALFGRVATSPGSAGNRTNRLEQIRQAQNNLARAKKTFKKRKTTAAAQALATTTRAIQTQAARIEQATRPIILATTTARTSAEALIDLLNPYKQQKNFTVITIATIDNASNQALADANALMVQRQKTGLVINTRNADKLQNAVTRLSGALSTFNTAPSVRAAENLRNAASALYAVEGKIRNTLSTAIAGAIRLQTAAAQAVSAATFAAQLLNRGNLSGRMMRRSINLVNQSVNPVLKIAKKLTRKIKSAQANRSASTWPSGCFQPNTYWNNWKTLVFYQMAPACAPNTVNGCPAGTAGALTINGNGNYRIITLVAGQPLNGQTHSGRDVVSNYLEGRNNNASRNGPATKPNTAFVQKPVNTSFNDQLAW